MYDIRQVEAMAGRRINRLHEPSRPNMLLNVNVREFTPDSTIATTPTAQKLARAAATMSSAMPTMAAVWYTRSECGKRCRSASAASDSLTRKLCKSSGSSRSCPRRINCGQSARLASDKEASAQRGTFTKLAWGSCSNHAACATSPQSILPYIYWKPVCRYAFWLCLPVSISQ